MKKLIAVTLTLLLVLSCLALTPQQAMADSSKNESLKWLPFGLAKKINITGYVLPPGIAKKYETGLQKIFDVKKLTRAQVAYILAEINSEEYKDFDDTNKVLKNVADSSSIPSAYRKAVAFVIDEELMSCKTQPKGKIVFEPNKTVTWTDVCNLLTGEGKVETPAEETPAETTYKGTVRYVHKIGNNTWIAVEAGGKLQTSYFAGDVPSGLKEGITITVKVDTESSRIIKSSLGKNDETDVTNKIDNLVLSVKASKTAPQVGDTLTFIPSLVNKSDDNIKLEDVSYRFTVKMSGTSQSWDFTASKAQDLRIPANNDSDPMELVAPSKNWTPAKAGEYVVARAQLRIGNGNWQDVAFDQSVEVRNLLTANQSSIETNTTGFSSYGFNTFAGSVLARDTAEKGQGAASLKITTNGINAWQGVNVNYQGDAIAGDLTFSFYVKAPQGTPLRAVIYDNTNAGYPSGYTMEFTASGRWERKTVTFKPTARTKDLSLQVTLNNYTTATVFYLDGLQLEKGDKATDWTLGGANQDAVVIVAP